MPPPSWPVLCCPLSDHVASVSVQIISPPLGWSPLSSFLVVWSPNGKVHQSSLRRLICPTQDRFIFLTLYKYYIYDFCPVPDPDVGLSILVCDVEHTSFHFGLCGRKFVLCLCGEHPGLRIEFNIFSGLRSKHVHACTT